MGGEKGSECMGGGGQYPFYCGRVIVCETGKTDWGGGGRPEKREGRETGLGLVWVCRVRERGVQQLLGQSLENATEGLRYQWSSGRS
jgi:hypothetical protein